MLLRLNDVNICYGKAETVKEINIEVSERSVVGIIGANGAGKSTLLKAISGSIPTAAGEIWFIDKKINGMKSHETVKLGIVHVPEGRRLFPYMSVMANLKIGAYLRKDSREIKKDLDEVFELFPRLKERRNQRASTLSGGEQQMLAIGRGIMAKPRLLLLDEPSLGLAPLMVQNVASAINDIHKKGISILLVEQNAGLVTEVADTGYVIETGKIVLHGKMSEIMENEVVKKAFLGLSG